MAVRKTEVRFRERVELLDFLLEVSTATSETLDLDRVLSHVGKVVKEVIPHDLFAILLYNEKAGGLRMRYSIGHREEVARSLVIPLGEGITGHSGASRQPILVSDVRSDARYLSALDAVRAELAVPMIARGRLVGIIDLQSTEVDAFTEDDQSLLTLIASRIAVSIDNARLYRRAERQNRTLRVLAHVSQEFSSILDLDDLLTKISSTVRAVINFDAFSVFLTDSEHSLMRQRFSIRFDQQAGMETIPLGRGIIGAAVEAREPIRVSNVASDPRYVATHPEIRSEVAIPLILQDRVVGVIDLESTRIGFFTDEHVRALSLLVPQIAGSIENARLYEELALREQRMDQDLKAARKLQSILLPRNAPALPSLELSMRSRPAREISGDIFDFYEDEDYSLIAFGDVSGKGAAAALYGALVSGLLRTLVPQRRTPAELLRDLNETLLERKVDAQYVTLLLLAWKPSTKTWIMANAGSLPPLIFRNGELVDHRLEGVPIGLLEDRDYDQIEFSSEPGDLILLYSDGIEDQFRGKDEDFGRVRLQKSLKAIQSRSPQQIIEAVFSELDAFRGATAISDDQTLLAIRVI